jgi:hypothetical protein
MFIMCFSDHCFWRVRHRHGWDEMRQIERRQRVVRQLCLSRTYISAQRRVGRRRGLCKRDVNANKFNN